jgi:glycine/D-amino acid oxidase-like deaminating enzyme
MSPRIVVVGGGVIGTSLAFRLAEAGTRVTLIEGGALAGGTSSTSFAWLNANGKPPLAYHRLNWAGLVEHLRLREEFGSAPWLHLSGNITWEDPARPGASEPAIPVRGERLADRLDRLAAWNYPYEVLRRDDLARWFPALSPPSSVDTFAFFPAEGYAMVPMLVGALASRATALGAEIHTHDPVTSLQRSGDRITGVITASGQAIDADTVVVCAGRWSGELLALAGIHLPMAPTLGLLAYTTPVATSHQSLVHSPRVNLRPDGGGRFVLANYDVDDSVLQDDSPATLLERAAPLLGEAAALLPAMSGSRIEAVRLGIRSLPADAFPVVGPVPGAPGLHVVATHSGVTMGPLLGRLTAQELLSGHSDERLATFRPDRLVSMRPPAPAHG